MKRTILLAALIFLFSGVFAQVVLTEDFSGTAFPPAGWTIDAQTANWKKSNTANAGGTAPEAKMDWSPQFNGVSRLISPSLDMSGKNELIVQFRHMVDHYSGGVQIGVGTRADGGDWNIAWSKNVNSSINPEMITVVVEDANVNSDNFQFCIFFSGSSYNINEWFIDNITLIAPAQTDMTVTDIATPRYFLGTQDVKASISNMGKSPVTSLKLNWQLDDAEIHTESLNNLNLVTGASMNHIFTDKVNAGPGAYDLKVWISNVNGAQGPDDVPENDTLVKRISIATHGVARKPMFEEFTSSTCGPCASFNNSVLNPFITQHGDELVLVKYQMNWPGSGDPYYTNEGGQRRNYYGVGGVPMLFVDGKVVSSTSAGVNTAFNNSLAKQSFVEIQGEYVINGTMVDISSTVTSFADILNPVMHVVVYEGVTTKNKRSNGETEFHHVMMRCLPDGNGNEMDLLKTGHPKEFSFSVDMTGTNVEEMDDLFVAFFLQDSETKDIFQAAYAVPTGAVVLTAPGNYAVNVSVDEPLSINFSQGVRHIGGEELTPANVSQAITLEEIGGTRTQVEFEAEVSADKTEILIYPAQLAEGTTYQLTINPFENFLSVPTFGKTVEFTTETTTGITLKPMGPVKVFPNPAGNSNTTVSGLSSLENIFSITLSDLTGKEISRFPLPAAGSDQMVLPTRTLQNGTYLLTVTSAKGVHTVRVVVAK